MFKINTEKELLGLLKVISEEAVKKSKNMLNETVDTAQERYATSLKSSEGLYGVSLSEQEEAEEVVAVEYSGDNLEIGFNVSYLQEILGVLGTEQLRISVSDANSSALVEGPGNEDAVYVVMPMRL